jgi:3-oxoacyl-[acyl-carrier protein] reductase
MSERRLEGKVALVSGGGRGVGTGIGSDICAKLAAAGAFVVVNYIDDQPAAEGVAAKIIEDGGRAFAIRGDVGGSLDAIKAFLQETDRVLTAELGSNTIDILVNNACQIWPHTIDATEEIFDEMLGVNLKGVWFLSAQTVSRMPRGGRIINISSQACRVAHPVVPLYSIAKHAMSGLTRNLGLILGPRGICVNGIEPGMTMSDSYMENLQAARGFATGNKEQRDSDPPRGAIEKPPELPGGGYDMGPELNAMVKSVTAMGRMANPSEISSVVVFLASDDARWVTGQTFAADGGLKL